MIRGLAAIGAIVACALAPSSSGQTTRPDRIAGIEVDGTTFIVRLTSGKTLSGLDLKGATLVLAEPGNAAGRKVLVDSVAVDPLDPDHETLLYHLFAVDSAGKTEELCGPDVRGEHWAFPVRGQWDAEGQHISNAGYTLTCGDGAQGKCVRFGYKPWKTLPNGTALAAYHQACIRMVRADYCGGHGTTRNGMLIDYYDNLGIQTPDPEAGASGVRFEAAWNASGAVCVAHTRVPENITLDQLDKDCPRLSGRLGEAVCSAQDSARWREPVLIYNGSR